MKKLILLSIIGVCANAYSQDKYAMFSFAGRDSSQISISGKVDDFTVYISGLTFDKVWTNGGFQIKSKQLQGFADNVKEAKAKYIEWKKTAEENNVKELSKQVALKPQKIAGNFYTTKWYFDYDVKPFFKYIIASDEAGIAHYLFAGTGKMTASDNEFIDHEGFYLLFQNEAEIDSFLSLLTAESINEFIKKPKAKDLFKD